MASLPFVFLTSCWNSSCYRQLLQGSHLKLERPSELHGNPLQWCHPEKHTRYMGWLLSESLRHAEQHHCVSSEENVPRRLLSNGSVTLMLLNPGPATCCSKVIKEARLVERKVCFILDASDQGGGSLASKPVQRPTAPTPTTRGLELL